MTYTKELSLLSDEKLSERFVLADAGSAALPAVAAEIQRRQMVRLLSLSATTEKISRKLLGVTWALAALTFLLLIFTVYLSYDAYQKNRASNHAHQSTTE